MPTQREAEPDERYICEAQGAGGEWNEIDSGANLPAIRWRNRGGRRKLAGLVTRIVRVHPDGRREVVG